MTEQLYWPAQPMGIAGPAQQTPEGWLDQLRRYGGVKPGDTVEFIVEDVADRFDLTVAEDGSYQIEPVVPYHGGANLYVTGDGHAASALGDLVHDIHQDGRREPWLFPVSHACRVISDRRMVTLQLRRVADRLQFDEAA